jgi:hypothetical protein
MTLSELTLAHIVSVTVHVMLSLFTVLSKDQLWE